MDVDLRGLIANPPHVFWRLPDVRCAQTGVCQRTRTNSALLIRGWSKIKRYYQQSCSYVSLTCPGRLSSCHSSWAPGAAGLPEWWSKEAADHGSPAGDAPPGRKPCPVNTHKPPPLSSTTVTSTGTSRPLSSTGVWDRKVLWSSGSFKQYKRRWSWMIVTVDRLHS